MDVAHLFEVETRTYKREWKLTRRTKQSDGSLGYVSSKIPVTDDDSEEALAKATALLAYVGEFDWEKRGDTHYVAVDR